MHLRLLAALPAVALGVAISAAADRADAQELHRWHAGLDFGYALLSGAMTSHGFGGGAHLVFDINDAFGVVAEVETSLHPSAQWAVVSGNLGVNYVIDVLRWVPWVAAVAGPAMLRSTDKQCGLAILEPCTAIRLNLEVPFGLDYRITNRFAIGAGGRFQLLVLGATSTWTTLGFFARAEVGWGR